MPDYTGGTGVPVPADAFRRLQDPAGLQTPVGHIMRSFVPGGP